MTLHDDGGGEGGLGRHMFDISIYKSNKSIQNIAKIALVLGEAVGRRGGCRVDRA